MCNMCMETVTKTRVRLDKRCDNTRKFRHGIRYFTLNRYFFLLYDYVQRCTYLELLYNDSNSG